MVGGGGIAEHVGAVPEDGDHLAVRARELGAERCAGAPAETGRGARSEIEIRRLEGAVLEEQRVFVDDDAVRILGAVDAMAHPRRIERRLARARLERALPGGRQRVALVLDGASSPRSTLCSSTAVNADMIATALPVIARSQGKPRIG